MSLHATEVAEHLGDELMRYRPRRLWRQTAVDLPVYLRKNRPRSQTRRSLLLISGVLFLSLCGVCILLFTDDRRSPAVEDSITARRHRLKRPEEFYSSTSVLKPLPILPVGYLFLRDGDYEAVPKQNLTVILPVDVESYTHLPSLLAPFFIDSHQPGEIIIASPLTIIGEVETIVHATLLTLREAHVPLHVRAWPEDLSAHVGWLHVAVASAKDWILILDERGIHDIDVDTLATLLSPEARPWPVGPRGVAFSPTNVTCIAHTAGTYWPAAFLLPPFVISAGLLREVESSIRMNNYRVWFSIGERVAGLKGSDFGGFVHTPHVHSSNAAPPSWCGLAEQQVLDPGSAIRAVNPRQAVFERYRAFQDKTPVASVALMIRAVLATFDELTAFAFTLCRMSGRGHSLRIFVLEHRPASEIAVDHLAAGGCHMHVDHLHELPLATEIDQLQQWLDRHPISRSVILHTVRQSREPLLTSIMRIYAISWASVMVELPPEDLSTSDWLAELTAEEWRNWEHAHVEFAVITNDRPLSLQRLLSSLKGAHYYGDRPLLSISVEQSSDFETLNVVQKFDWPGVDYQLRHRVIHGGLLPAVVEAWYPHTNDSYGVLLEDDVELSPMFYAWIKFAILRYRYGSKREETDRLFGISLYQARHVELRTEGRRPFHAQTLFSESGIRYPHTPYLSQIPCSWGAVYFPEHWREFHDYLTLRLSEIGKAMPNDIVPNIRSNKWSRSWKRYFIELTYLRGYVMLYPNYDHFVSLSTNHLEIGAHAHDLPERPLAKKKAQFQVPLMSSGIGDYGVHLLDLPQGTLPAWRDLPVLDLWGNLSSHGLLKWRGAYRHEEVANCRRLLSLDGPSSYSAAELLCLQDDVENDDEDEDLMEDDTLEDSNEVEQNEDIVH